MGKGNVVTFEVSVPEGVATRSYTADGSNVNDLVYAVYSTEATTLEDAQNGPLKFFYAVNETQEEGQSSFSDGKSIVSLELLNNQNYLILFWAQSNDAWVSAQESDIDLLHVTYPSSMSANNMHLEAFSGVAFIQNVKGARKETVKLTRPFAQINLATTMPEAFTAKLSQSSMTVTGAPAYFDVQKQSASEKTTEEPLSFTAANVPDADFGKDGYEYAGANYIFAGAENTVDVEYNIYTSHGVVNNEVPSVPVQKNYRTNIIGNLLTSTAGYTVELDNRWGTPDYQVELWDGKTIKAVTPNENDNNIYEIDEPSELAWLAAAVNGTLPESKSTIAAQDFAGKTFRLTKDINLDNREWTPIGNGTAIFKGTFDGQNHTVKNLLINGSNKQDQGLFGVTHDGEIKNLVVENAMVSGRLNVGVVAGQPYTSKYTNITVKGHVEVNGMAYVGGVGGMNAYADWTGITVDVDETSYVKANSVENGTAYRTYVGGVVGFNGEGGHKFSNIKSNINVEGSTCDVGGLFGIAHYNNQFEECVCTGGVTITTDEVENALEMGGIAGVWHNENGTTVTLTNCSFTGNLVTPNITEEVNFYYGGLIGNPYSATGTGKLIINGNIYVTTAAELQAALDDATGEVTICFGDDIVGDVTVNQKEGVNVVINGLDKKYDGTITIDGNNRNKGAETLKIQNIKFETETPKTFVSAPDEINGNKERYSHNVTVMNCTFYTPTFNKDIVAISTQKTYHFAVQNCSAENMHSLLQVQSCDNDVRVDDVTVTNCKNGVSFGNTKTATISNSTINTVGYGVRADGTDMREVSLTVTGCTINAYIPVVVRRLDASAQKFTLNVNGSNNLTMKGDYHVVMGSNEYEEGVDPIKPESEFEINVAENFKVYPRDYYCPVATWAEFTARLDANEAKIKLTADITYDANYQLQKDVVIDLNGMSMTLPMINIHKNVTIKNGTINGKMYARTGCKVTLESLTYSGTISDDLSTEGHLQVQGGCDVYAKDCVFAATTVNGSQTRSLSIEGSSSGTRKFENCDFKFVSWGTGAGKYKKNVYINTMNGTTTVDFTDCKLNGKAPNIIFAAAYPLTNLTMSGCDNTAPTLEISRAKDTVTEVEWAHISSLIANNKFTQVRVFYAGGSSEYIK